MIQIAFTKNGLPLVIYTQFIILFVVCMPLCSTGIVKREIQPSNATKLIWQPIKIANNTSANVTATTTLPTTTLPVEVTTTKTTTRPIELATTPRISRGTSTSTSTTEKITTHATTEKDAEIIPKAIILKENVTIAPPEQDGGAVIDSQPVSDKNNLDDDAEVNTFGDSDSDGVTTEEHRFDLSRYTSDYNGNDNDQNDFNETHQQLNNENESDRDEPLSTFNIGYDHNVRDMVLTTPESPYFDEKHKEYEHDKSYERYQDENTAPVTESEPVDNQYNSDRILNDIHGNSTEEHKQSTYLNRADVESMNYDISASEVKDNIGNSTGTGEKKAKFMQEGSHVNLTIPEAGEVWALASMKKVEHTKNSQGQFYNVTELDKEPDKNGTLVTKQLADWVEVTKNNDYTNSSYTTKNGNNNTSEETKKDDDTVSSGTTNNISNTTSEGKMQLGDWLEALRNLNLTLNSSNYIPRRRNNLANNTSWRRSNSTNNISNDASQGKPRANITEILKNINLTMSRLTANNNILNRGRLKFQQKPLIIKDQDSASQENHIIAVQMTTLPPPIGVTKQYTQATHTSMPIFPEVSDSENKVNIQQMGVTDVVSENDGMETTTTEMETTQNIDNSQNELKNRFTTLRPRSPQKEFETTTDRSSEAATEVEQTTFAFDFDEIPTTTQVYETTTNLRNIEPEYDVRTTTEKEEFPTTNQVNVQTDSVTEMDEDDDEHTMYEQSSITTATRPHTSEQEILESQSSTLQPKYIEIEKTTEMRNPTTEFTRTTTENVQPTTEFVTKMENKVNDRLPDLANKEELTTNIINLNRDEYRYGTIKSNLLDTSTQGLHTADAFPEVIDDITHSQDHTPTTDGQIPDIGGFSLDEPDTNAIIAISVSVVGVVVVGTIVGVLFIMRKRQKQLTYGQRCRPVGLDAYSLDNVSVYNSVRRKGVLRMSKRSYGNAAFDDPGLKNNLLSATSLAAFAQKKNEIYEEFKELPTVTARAEEVPPGCEDKNRYANIIPLPESRVFLKRIGDDEKSEYINANFVKGPKDGSHYYIACQGPLDSTVIDFWRMIWEQNSRVIIMATDIIENGIEQCAEYLPPSFVIDNHVTFGDFNITLKHREVKEKYAMSMVHLKNTNTNTWREVTHFWYQWPDTGVPTEQSSLIELLLEARGYLKVSTAEQMDDNENSQNNNGNLNAGNGGVDKSKSLLRTQGPLTVHCSPGTGRTGTIIACDIALRALELPTKSVDIPQIVYFVRRGRASAVRTREQYEFIYKVANVYAAKLTGSTTEN